MGMKKGKAASGTDRGPRRSGGRGQPGARGEAGGPDAGTMTLTDLDQVWALADPLRVRMLGAFAQERTTRQVAEVLGEKPTRLYHHLKALADAGLVRKTRTRRNRGTLETYYRAVAGSFRPDPALFAPPGRSEAADSIGKVIDTMLDQTRSELRALLAAGSGAVEDEGLVGFLEVHAPEGVMKKLRARLDGLVKSLEQGHRKAKTGRKKSRPDRRYRLSIVFFPLDSLDP